MKKILLLLFILGVMSFSDCSYTNSSNYFIKQFIQSVKEEKLDEKIYCDKNNIKMLYYKDYDIQIGLIYETDLNSISEDEFLGLNAEFSKDAMKLLDKFSRKTRNVRISDDDIPNFLNIRMYVEEPNGNIFMIARVHINVETGDTAYTFSNELKLKLREYLKSVQDFEYYFTSDIIY